MIDDSARVRKMSELTRDGTTDSVLRHQIVRRERGHGSIKLLCSSSRIGNGNLTRLIYITYFKRRPWMRKAMYVRSSLIAEDGSTGKGCQSCSWSAEQGKLMFTYNIINILHPYVILGPTTKTRQFCWARPLRLASPSSSTRCVEMVR